MFRARRLKQQRWRAHRWRWLARKTQNLPTNPLCDYATRTLRRRNTSADQTGVTRCSRRPSVWATNCVTTTHPSGDCHEITPTIAFENARALFAF